MRRRASEGTSLPEKNPISGLTTPGIIEALLKQSRVGQEKSNAQTTSLSALAQEVVAELAADSQGRQIDWRIGALPSVECDPGLMRQVFSNLLGNAVKYTRHAMWR